MHARTDQEPLCNRYVEAVGCDTLLWKCARCRVFIELGREWGNLWTARPSVESRRTLFHRVEGVGLDGQCGADAGSLCIAESSRIPVVLFGMQNGILGPNLAAIHRLLVPVSVQMTIGGVPVRTSQAGVYMSFFLGEGGGGNSLCASLCMM
jgi:hypothetical protein